MRQEKTQQESLLDRFMHKPSLIQEIEQRLERDDRIGINIGLQEGLLLKALCSQPSVEKVVEIGTQYGCSAAWMALGLGDKGTIFTLEKDPQCIENSQLSFQHAEFVATGCEVQLLEGEALENLSALEEQGPFDLIFIDANKSAYLEYLHWSQQNISSHGIIAIDNVYLFDSVFETTCPEKTPKKMWNVMQAVLKEQLQHPDYHTSIVPTPEGLLLSYKKH
jgi:caffeoyl-CoA O-methyltransferase